MLARHEGFAVLITPAFQAARCGLTGAKVAEATVISSSLATVAAVTKHPDIVWVERPANVYSARNDVINVRLAHDDFSALLAGATTSGDDLSAEGEPGRRLVERVDGFTPASERLSRRRGSAHGESGNCCSLILVLLEPFVVASHSRLGGADQRPHFFRVTAAVDRR